MQFEFMGKKVSLKGVSETDWIYSIIKKSNSFYELDLLKYARYALKDKTGCIIDVGANIGNHSVFFGLFVSHKIICFEPNPSVLPILRANLTENNICHNIFDVGLSDKNGNFDIVLHDSNNIGATKLVENQTQGINSVKVTTLDSLMPEIKSFISDMDIIALKMDVEEMEHLVISGATKTLREYKPDLFIEVQNKEQMHNIQKKLIPLGYIKITSWAATPVWHFLHRDNFSSVKFVRLYIYIYWTKFLHLTNVSYKKLRLRFCAV